MAGFELPEPPPLATARYDRADHLRDDADRLRAGWATARVLMVDHRGGYPVRADGALRWAPTIGLAPAAREEAVFLGVLGETDLWALRTDELADPVSDPRSGAHLLSPDEAGLLATALGILNWHRAAGFAPMDGSATTVGRAGWVRRTAGGAEEYPRTDPAVIMVVHDDADRILLGRQQAWPPPFFSTLAGFVEPGESLEQCVLREVAEEVGVTARSPHYLGSQPWPFPRSLMLGFEAVADPDEPITLHDGELAEARWFTRDQVRAALDGSADWGSEVSAELLLPPSVSIARSLIAAWARARPRFLEWPVPLR